MTYDDMMDKLAVTLNAMTVHPDEFKALDIDKAIQIMETCPDAEELQRQAVSQLGGGSKWSLDWRTLQALTLCGVQLVLRGQVPSGLALLIAVNVLSKRSEVGSRTGKRATGQQEQGRKDGTRATGQKTSQGLQ